jgi:hypothetical protein
MERTDDAGLWVSDDGVSWSLVAPSPDWDKGDDPEPSIGPLEQLMALPAPMRTAILTFAKEMVLGAGGLWDALADIPEEDPSHPAIEIITDAALTAALPLLG